MTKEKWKWIKQKLKDAELYARDAGKRLRVNPKAVCATTALRRIEGARAALDAAEDELIEYVQEDAPCFR